MMDDISFALIVNIPTIVLVVLTFIGGIPGEYGRRALIVHAALLITVYGTLFGVALSSAVVVYVAVIAGLGAAALSGPWGLLVAAGALGVIAVAAFATTAPFAPLGPVIAFASAAAAFVQSRVTGRF